MRRKKEIRLELPRKVQQLVIDDNTIYGINGYYYSGKFIARLIEKFIREQVTVGE